MRRRDFIKGIAGSAAAAWPLGLRAQQTGVMPRISAMIANAEDSRDGRQQARALREGLQELGWRDGSNIRIDFHWDIGEPGRAHVIAKDIVAEKPDLIVSHTTPVTAAVFELTKTIPIVFVNVSDPVGLGLVSSFARPGGNITGFTNFEASMGGKWLELLKEVDPRIGRVTILFNPETAPARGKFFLPSFKAAGSALGVEAIEAPVYDTAGIEQAIAALTREATGGLVAMADIFTSTSRNRKLIIRLAADNHLPLIAAFPTFPEEGGLISYGASTIDVFRRAVSYVDRILKGANPTDLPVQAPTKFEMVINLKTAKALGLTFSPQLLAIADEVIE